GRRRPHARCRSVVTSRPEEAAMHLIPFAFAALLATAPAPVQAPAPATAPAPAPRTEEVGVLKTNLGTMVFRFFEADAPATSAAIKRLVRAGFYDGKTFYRVVKGHVIQ